MLSLHRSGRSPEVLVNYIEWSARVREEWGIEPGEAIKQAWVEVITPLRIEDQPLPPVRGRLWAELASLYERERPVGIEDEATAVPPRGEPWEGIEALYEREIDIDGLVGILLQEPRTAT
jgi:hypothetical protein